MDGKASFIESINVESEDPTEIATFLSKSFPFYNKDKWMIHLSKMWENNPVFPLSDDRGVILHHNRQIVGFLARFPTKMQFNGREVITSNASNLAVHEKYRKQGLATRLRLEYAERTKDTIAFATTPGTEATFKINRRVGFTPIYNNVDKVNEIDSLIVLDSLKVLDGFKIFAKSRKYLRFLNYCASWMIYLINKKQICRLKKQVSHQNCQVVELTKADKSFDKLWAETKDDYLLTNVRTAEAVNWHLYMNQTAKRSLYVCYESGKNIGYMIFEDKKIRAISVKYCVDVWFKKNHENYISSVLKYIIDQKSTQTSNVIMLPHFNKTLSKVYSSVGLFRFRGKRLFNYITAPEEIKNLLDRENVYLVHLQGDRGFF